MPPKSVRILAYLIAVAGLVLPVSGHGQSALIPLTTRRDMVFDHAGKYLYISTSDGFVQRYNLATNQIENSYNLGGSLNGLDIAPDDTFLLVAQAQLENSQGQFQKLNLATGAVTNIAYSPATAGEAGGYSVAITANGIALVTTARQSGTSGGNSFPLRAIDLASNAISVRQDVTGLGDSTWLDRSSDGQLIYSLLGNGLLSYNSDNDNFTITSVAQGDASTALAANRDRSLFARVSPWYGASIDTVADLTFVHNFSGIVGGAVFDPTRDVLYGVHPPSGSIIAFDSKTFAELFRLDIGEPLGLYPWAGFDTGHLVASPDGRYLVLVTPTGVRLFTIPTPPYPSPAAPDLGGPRGMAFDHAGKYLYVTTSTGFVLGFNVATTNLDRIYNAGGWLYGIDIASDDSFAVVAQADQGMKQGAVQKIDLNSGAITNFNYDRNDSERGAYDVHLTANNRAFFSTIADSAAVPIRQIDLATGTITPRSVPNSHWGTVNGDVQIQRSADGNLLYFLEPNSSGGLTFTYNANTDTLGAGGDLSTYFDLTNAAVSRNGTLACIRYSSFSAQLQAAPDFHTTHFFSDFDYGIAFDPVKDVLYGVTSTTNEIIAYDTNTFAELSRMWIGEDLSRASTGSLFGIGSLVASPNGRYLALLGPDTILLFDLQNPPGPRPDFTITAIASPQGGGIIGGAGVYHGGADVGLSATQNRGYNFVNWTENGPIVSTSPYFTFQAYSNRSLVANFQAVLPIVSTPTTSPNGGTFKKKATVKLSCATAGATIFYTLDDSDPTNSSSVYSTSKKNKGIKVTGKGTHTVKAKAAENGYIDSAVATATFTIH